MVRGRSALSWAGRPLIRTRPAKSRRRGAAGGAEDAHRDLGFVRRLDEDDRDAIRIAREI